MVADILIDEDFEVMMSGGDIAGSDCREQLCSLLAHSERGEWKNAPQSGWGLQRAKNAPESEISLLKPRILEDFKRNNVAATVSVADGNIDINFKEE